MLVSSTWSESQARIVRWLLLAGWLGLILTLLVPGLDPWPFGILGCRPGDLCQPHDGNFLFWGAVVPTGLLMLVVLSHEVWRRVCPLAFVSQLFRALGRQRTVAGKGGRPEVVRIDPQSWLGRNHVRLQWALFIAGLCLRLLLVNSHALALGVFLLLTILAALLVGWAYGGKAWCQYFCPMAPVQTVVTGPRSFFGTTAHLDTGSRITQSMCRTIGENGRLQSACVACQAPCIDIDSERVYWQTLTGKRGLTWAWYSYPGLVLGFYLLMQIVSLGGLSQAVHPHWAHDPTLAGKALAPLPGPLGAFGLPRLLTIPALLTSAGGVSVFLFERVERWQHLRLAPSMGERAEPMARQRTRLVATFTAVNAFFAFADPTLGLSGAVGGQILRSIVLVVSGLWLYRGWARDRGTYARESTSASLRRQLDRLLPDLAPYLEGRSLDDLSPDEVFTLARVLPAQISETKRGIYRAVMTDLFGSGRLERAAAMVQLEELRASLGLVEEDHHAALRELAISDPRILQLDDLQRATRNVRQEAAAEAIRDMLELHSHADPDMVFANPVHRDRLERIRRDCGLDDDAWQQLLARFGSTSEFLRERLQQSWERMREQLAARRELQEAASADAWLQPLLPVMDRRLASLCVTLWPQLGPFGADDPLVHRFASLVSHVPEAALTRLRRRDQALLAPEEDADPASLEPLPDVESVLEELWSDPDPDTALWVLWTLERRAPERASALRLRSRAGLPSNPALERLLRGEGLIDSERLGLLLQVPLVAGLSPGALMDMARWGADRRLQPGEVLFRIGDPPDIVAILLEGVCQVFRNDGSGNPMALVATIRPGESIGEVAFFSPRPRRAEVRAGAEPALVLVFSGARFEQLLHDSSEFSHGLLRQLALRVETLYATFGPAGVPR